MKFNTNTDDISMCFNVIQETKPISVLDVGLMLVSNNIIARQAGEIMLPNDTLMYALKTDDFQVFPIYNRVYEGIYDIESVRGHEFELAVFLADDISYSGLDIFFARYILADYRHMECIEKFFFYEEKLTESVGAKDYNLYIECSHKL